MAHEPKVTSVKCFTYTPFDINIKPKNTSEWYKLTPDLVLNDVQLGYVSNTNALQENCLKLPVNYSWAFNFSYVEFNITTGSSSGSYSAGIVGRVIDVVYINANTTRVDFVIDGWITNMINTKQGNDINIWGTIERMSIGSDLSYNNLLAEPFTVSDNLQTSNAIQNWFNETIKEFQGDEWGYLLIISDRVAEYHPTLKTYYDRELGGLLGFDPIWFNGNFKYIGEMQINENGEESPGGAEFPSVGFTSYMLGGESVAGLPLMFTTQEKLNKFITELLKSGYQRLLKFKGGNMSVWTGVSNWINSASSNESIQMERLLFTHDDIYSIQRVPLKFGYTHSATTQQFVTPIFPTHNVNFGKLTTYPYIYFKIRTNVGGECNLIPHIHFNRDDPNDPYDPPTRTCTIELSYIGGMSPRIVCRFLTAFDGSSEDTPRDDNILVRDFSTLNFSSDKIANTNAARQMSFMQSIRATTSSIRYGQGFRAMRASVVGAIAGGKKGSKAGAGGAVAGAVGGLIAGDILSRINDEQNLGQQLFDNRINHVNNALVEYNAPNNTVTNLTGNFESELPPFSVYQCGCTSFEIQGINEQMKSIGVRVQTYGKQFGNNSKVPRNKAGANGLEYWQFSNIDLMENVKGRYKDEIANLFLNGIYLKTDNSVD